MPAITRKMADLKDELFTKINKKLREFKSDFITEIKNLTKNEVSEAIRAEIRKQEELESVVALLQQNAKNF